VLMRDLDLAAEAEVAGMVQNAQNQQAVQSRLQASMGVCVGAAGATNAVYGVAAPPR
jgi:hypothetical protein